MGGGGAEGHEGGRRGRVLARTFVTPSRDVGLYSRFNSMAETRLDL